AALHMAIRELAPHHRAPDRVDDVLAVLKAFALRANEHGGKLRDRWQPGIDVPAVTGRADSGDIEIDLVELFTDAASLATDVGTGIALFIDEMQDLGPADVSALCAACHELSQLGAPLIVVGAGLPHLPAVLSAAKSYSERLFRYQRIDRLDRIAADLALCAPAGREDVEYEPKALDLLYEKSGGYPYFVQAYGKATWDHAPRSPVTAADVRVAAPEAEAELAVGFFGARFERATPAEREYMRTMAALAADPPGGATGQQHQDLDAAVSTADIARALGRKPASLSPARDALIKKGLVYSGERGTVAFTVPHFGRYLRTQPG
ncbi:MAG TPA: ATP-binding protein, partial [Catenuloplanes sp.]